MAARRDGGISGLLAPPSAPLANGTQRPFPVSPAVASAAASVP